MSASLVGSEMCIRDRLRFALAALPPAAHSCVPAAGTPTRSGVEGWGSVSYTHLTLPTICSV
eukprot:934443-Alexandrium_andersonii.AAC.1